MIDNPEHPELLARDEAGIRALRLQVSALARIVAELRGLAAGTDDFETAAILRQRDAEVSEKLESARMRLSRARASGISTGLTADERRRHTEALARLDRYVRDDQNIHHGITYLMQIANCFE